LAVEDARRRGDAALEMEMQNVMLKIGDWHRHMPLSQFPPLKRAEVGAYLFDWLAHPMWDAYWQAWSIRTRYAQISVPALHIGGWYDVFLEGTLQNYQGICAQGANATARQNQQLLIGPWTHMPWAPRVGESDFGRAAGNVVDDAIVRFFERWLKEVPSDAEREPPVRLFVMGENRWLAASDFPPSNVRPQDYFLHSGGAANSAMGDGVLDPNTPLDEPFDTFCHDPLWPVPSVGGHSCCFPEIAPMGPHDQRDVESRNDVLVFTTAVLTGDLTVCGTVTATLYASTSARDTDFAVKLVDVWPDGRALNLCDGILRARYRNGLDHAELLEPDTVYELNITVGSTCNVFRAGHRLRIQIASSNFPMYDRNPGDGGDIANATFLDLRSAMQNIFHDARYPSHVRLPIIAQI
jgi:putative CocE/NonD family hydrolase